MAITPTTNAATPPVDYSLPDVPDFFKPTGGVAKSIPANPYTGDAAQYYNAYSGALGRGATQPEMDFWMRHTGQSLADKVASITGSPEARQYGRARNEINPLIDAQIAGFGRQAELERQTGLSQLAAIRPQYDVQRNDLQFGLDQNNSALDYRLSQLRDDTDFAGSRLTRQLNPAILGARQSAARSGLLNSTIAIDRVNSALQPLTDSLENLARDYTRGSSDVERQRQNYVADYQRKYGNLGTQEQADVRGVRDRVALMLQQLGNQSIESESTRAAKIYARSGEIGDTIFTQDIAKGTLQEQIAARIAQNELARQQMAEQRRQFDVSQTKK